MTPKIEFDDKSYFSRYSFSLVVAGPAESELLCLGHLLAACECLGSIQQPDP